MENKVIKEKGGIISNSHENFIDLDNYKISYSILRRIHKDMAYKHCVFPFYENDSEIYVAMNTPADIVILNDIRFVSKKDVVTFKADKEQILSYIKLFYEINDGKIAVEEMKRDFKDKKHIKDLGQEELLNNAPSVRLVDSIIYQAINKKASDIHLEPFKNHLTVRIRVDGIMQEIMKLPIDTYNSLTIRIKIMAKMNITLRKTPQDGKINYERNGESYDFRVSSIPTLYGEKIVIRILYKSTSHISLEKLAGENAGKIHKILKSPNGIILITGPTGSGKSTTMYAILKEINSVEKNILTIEDPVEFTIDNVNQISVNNKAGLTFASGLRSMLRQDPDVIFVGEIRDEETAQVAIRAAITGHLVVSTLHTNDSSSSVVRLIDMGIKPYLVSHALVGVIAQRLIRVICPYCKTKYNATELEKKVLNLRKNVSLYKGETCSKCSNTGYIGRKAVFEIMKIDDTIKNLIYEGASLDKIRNYALNSNMESLKSSTLKMVINGITTFDEYMKIVYVGQEDADELL